MQQTNPLFLSLTCALSVLLIVGCSSVPDKANNDYQLKSTRILNYSNNPKVVEQSVIHELYQQHREWQGVRYRLGGTNKTGIDCSAFVQLTYKSKLGIHLPRTTRQQSRLGIAIRKHELEPGDLVFFRTGPTSKHVGIYLEQNKFLHASQRKGVTISSLDNIYWQAKYWKSVRL